MDKSFYNALLKKQTAVSFELDYLPSNFDEVGFLPESNPYPADHRYKILISNPPLNKMFKTWKPGIKTEFTTSEVSSILLGIGHVRHSLHLINNKDTSKIRYKYFINNVEYLDIDNDKIIVEGVCSAIISDFKKPIGYKYGQKSSKKD